MPRMRRGVASTWHSGGASSQLPANGTKPNGSTYLATDSGQPWKMVGGIWMPDGAPAGGAAGRIIAGPVRMTAAGSFDVKAIGAVNTDVPGMTLNVPASSVATFIRHKWEVQANSGTSVAGSTLRVIATITDNANAVIAAGGVTFIQVTAVATVFQAQINLEALMDAPFAGGTYKLRAQLSSAAPANWTSALLFPSIGQGGAGAADNFYAQAAA